MEILFTVSIVYCGFANILTNITSIKEEAWLGLSKIWLLAFFAILFTNVRITLQTSDIIIYYSGTCNLVRHILNNIFYSTSLIIYLFSTNYFDNSLFFYLQSSNNCMCKYDFALRISKRHQQLWRRLVVCLLFIRLIIIADHKMQWDRRVCFNCFFFMH